MSFLAQRHALRQVIETLSEVLATPPAEARFEPIEIQAGASRRLAARPDLLVDIGSFEFLVEWRGAGSASEVGAAVQWIRRHAEHFGEAVIPLVAVPYMGDVGRQLCAEGGVAWLDLSGNAQIVAPGLRIQLDGRPNRFKSPGRPASVFAPKSSRIARCLLLRPDRSFTQRELARSAGMDEGFTSRIVRKLEADGLVVRDSSRAVKARDPDLLLDAWREAYAFSKHDILRGHVPARSGDELLGRLAAALAERDVDYAATGLAGAWLHDRFAAFRLVTLYLHEPPGTELLQELLFREEPRGANVWLVVPNDEGVFHGASSRDGFRAVHPVQVYLDLQGHPERANEAAVHLRGELSSWRSHG